MLLGDGAAGAKTSEGAGNKIFLTREEASAVGLNAPSAGDINAGASPFIEVEVVQVELVKGKTAAGTMPIGPASAYKVGFAFDRDVLPRPLGSPASPSGKSRDKRR